MGEAQKHIEKKARLKEHITPLYALPNINKCRDKDCQELEGGR